MRALWLSLVALLAAGCFPPDLGDGAIACGANGACPPKYFCHRDQRCWKTPDTSGGFDMAIDGGGAMDMTLQDLAGADLTICTKAICGNRNCGMIPDGCGGVESCGMMCPAQQSCGAGNPGMANVCAGGKMCVPKQCQSGDCGLISDGCSAVLACGACPGQQICGADHMCH